MELFDFIKALFSSGDAQWKKVTTHDKNRNFFMATRFMSIKYPVQAATLNHHKVNAASVMDCWHRTMSMLHGGKVPSWVYAKTKKKDKEEAKKLPSEAMVRWHCEKNELSRKDYDAHVKFFGETFLSEIRETEKLLRSQGLLTD